MEGAPNPDNPICPGLHTTGPPPSMVKSGISTIEDLSCKTDQQTVSSQCCPATAENNSAEISALTETKITVNVTEEQKTVTEETKTATTKAVTNSNSGKTIPDVAIVLVHNH